MHHSLDKWFINRYRYSHPPFHREGLNYFDAPTVEEPLTRKQLIAYFGDIRGRINRCLSGLSDKALGSVLKAPPSRVSI